MLWHMLQQFWLLLLAVFDAVTKHIIYLRRTRNVEVLTTQGLTNISTCTPSINITSGHHVIDILNFNNPHNLQHINNFCLNGSMVKYLPEFKGMHLLTQLTLTNNCINSIKSISSLVNLTSLNISNNPIGEGLYVLGNLKALKELRISNIRLDDSNFPDISNLENLHYLDISMNDLKKIPEVFNLKSLWMLDLRDNRLDQIDERIIMLSELRRFHVENNNIETIPLEILELKDLVSFGVSGNLFGT
jgi:Leucine-rich repeat (LRR) protein